LSQHGAPLDECPCITRVPIYLGCILLTAKKSFSQVIHKTFHRASRRLNVSFNVAASVTLLWGSHSPLKWVLFGFIKIIVLAIFI